MYPVGFVSFGIVSTSVLSTNIVPTGIVSINHVLSFKAHDSANEKNLCMFIDNIHKN